MRNSTLLILFVSFSMLLLSCKKDDDAPPPTPPTTQDTPPAKPSSRSSSANSEAKTGSFDKDGNTFLPIDDITTPQGLHGVGKLTQTSRRSSDGKIGNNDDYAWLVDEVFVNGTPVDFLGDPDINLDLAFFFLEDGTYDVYSFPLKEWYWGYWYATEDAKFLVIDPDTEFELLFDINALTNQNMSIGLADDEGNTFDLELNAYSEGDGEYTSDITSTDLQSWLTGVFWEMGAVGYYDAGGNYVFDDAFPIDLTTYFTDENEVFLAVADQAPIEFGNPLTYPEIELADYTFDLNTYTITLDYKDGSSEVVYLVYVDAEFMVFALDDPDIGYIEFIFAPIDLPTFSNTMVGNTWEEIGTYDEFGVVTETSVDWEEITFNSNGTYNFNIGGSPAGTGNYVFDGSGAGILITLTGDQAGEGFTLFYSEFSLVIQTTDELTLYAKI